MKKHVKAVKMICIMLAAVFALAVAAPTVPWYGPDCGEDCPTITSPRYILPVCPDGGDD